MHLNSNSHHSDAIAISHIYQDHACNNPPDPHIITSFAS